MTTNRQDTPMDQRVFGPYYSTPPEARGPETSTQQVFRQPLQPDRPTRTSLRQRLLAGRRKRRDTRP